MRRRIGLALLAPVVAIAFAVVVSSIVLVASGHSPLEAYRLMLDYAWTRRSFVSIVNRATPLYIAGLAVAIGFKMNLFNIGVEGQYRLAALLAASAGAAVSLPAVLHVPFIILVAMLVGGAWAGVAGVLKVTRGVHEVIATIMLNTIATGLAAYLLATHLRAKTASSDLVTKTPDIDASGRMPPLNRLLDAIGLSLPRGAEVYGFVVVALLVGVAFWLLVWRTRFGFDLRASGVNPWAARASGVDPGAMTVRTMVLSGAIAGLAGMPELLGQFGRYTIDFPTGYGFNGIAVALLGRNHPVGVGFGALLFAFLDRSAQVLDFEGIPREIVVIMQGVILLSVVVAYEVVHRMVLAREARAAAELTGRLPAGEAAAA